MKKLDKRDIIATPVRNVEELKRRYDLDKEQVSVEKSAEVVLPDVIPIAQGGTGATTVVSAKANLGLHKIASSGSYNDLSNKPNIPTVPTNVSSFSNDVGYLTEETDPTVPSYVKNITQQNITSWNNKSNFSGSYNDLTNKPTIPTVPTSISSFTNDSGYITAEDIPSIPTVPSNVSAFTNDSGYLTSIPSEYVTETELNNKGYLTSIPTEYVTEAELNNKGYLTSIPTEYVTETELTAKNYVDTSVFPLPINKGGTGATTQEQARANLGITSSGGVSILDVYPVGSIYMTCNSVDPSILFGGVWEQIKDTFLLASGDKHIAGETGGEEAHTLTIEEMPQHKHTLNYEPTDGHYNGSKTEARPWGASKWGDGTGNTGGSQPHNNMPPYLVVNVWVRME